jgi:alpha-N-acetylglucosaminidase
VTIVNSETPERSAVEGILKRWLPDAAQHFTLESLVSDDGLDVFEIESVGDKVVLRGSTGVAQASALNWYLKYFCNCHISWDSPQLNLPQPLPRATKVRMSTPYPYRYYFNYCTFSYSMPFWDWERWEREIDWMALNGINAPLSVTGQEAIWQAVYRQLGLTDAQIDEFVVGAAYLPYGWMGCIDGWAGPLPARWISDHAALQQQIVARQRALGMTPILQGFTGHVPPALPQVFPDCTVHELSSWAGFTPTYFLDAADPLFERIGRAFIEEQTRQFGTDHLYAADTFIEMVPASSDPAFLTALSQSIYRAMASADPQAVWVLQGWPFLFREDFWQPPQIRAVLDGVPDERLLLLDLYADEQPQWRKTEAFYGRPWVWCMLHNFGGRPGLYGNLEALARELPAALNDPKRGQLAGIGISTEAIETNPILYDLLCEMTWHRETVDPAAWTSAYAARRYGQRLDAAEQAWSLLRETVYHPQKQLLNRHGVPMSVISNRPTLKLDGGWRPKGAAQVAPVMQAWKLLLDCAEPLHGSSGYGRDLVDVSHHALTLLAEALHTRMVSAYEARNAVEFHTLAERFLQLISDMDGLAATRGEYLLGRWIASARRHGDTAAEQAQLEWNARNLLTLWGAPDSMLHDYSCRYWSGLLGTFYRPRWELLIRQVEGALASGTPFDAAAFERDVIALEDAWTHDLSPMPTEPVGDSVQMAHQLFANYRTLQTEKESP